MVINKNDPRVIVTKLYLCFAVEIAMVCIFCFIGNYNNKHGIFMHLDYTFNVNGLLAGFFIFAEFSMYGFKIKISVIIRYFLKLLYIIYVSFLLVAFMQSYSFYPFLNIVLFAAGLYTAYMQSKNL